MSRAGCAAECVPRSEGDGTGRTGGAPAAGRSAWRCGVRRGFSSAATAGSFRSLPAPRRRPPQEEGTSRLPLVATRWLLNRAGGSAPSPARGRRVREAAAVCQRRGARGRREGPRAGGGLAPVAGRLGGAGGRAPLCAALPRAGVAQERAAVTPPQQVPRARPAPPGRRALVQPARGALPRRCACSGSGAASAPVCRERATSPWRNSAAGRSGRLDRPSAAAGAPGGAWKGLGGPQVFSALSSARFRWASLVFALLCLVIFLYFFPS